MTNLALYTHPFQRQLAGAVTPCNGLTEEFYATQPAAVVKQICDGCPLRNDCLQYALDTDEEWGVWGGLTAAERRRLTGRNRTIRSRASQCSRGHFLSGANVRELKRGGRTCRACDLDKSRERAYRRQLAA